MIYRLATKSKLDLFVCRLSHHFKTNFLLQKLQKPYALDKGQLLGLVYRNSYLYLFASIRNDGANVDKESFYSSHCQQFFT